MILIFYLISIINHKEIVNFITAFLVIDLSNGEKKNLELKNRIKFYDSITIACKSLLCGFVAPLFYILVFSSNFAGILYAFIYNISETKRHSVFEVIWSIFSIIPAFITQFFLYIIYIFRNKSFKIDFKGDYIVNSITRPLLNLEIMAAYIESVNFYYHFHSEDMSYVKSYGGYNNKIDDICIKDYLSITYALSFLFFALFILTTYLTH